MSLNYGPAQDSIDNRRDFLKKFGVDHKELVCAKQVHGDRIKLAGSADKGSGALVYDNAVADTDAFLTDRPYLPLAIFTADCLPVFLYDSENHAAGLVHAGWKGSQAQITAKAVRLMQKEFTTRPRQLYAGFGPAIRECCYEVGKEFNGYFTRGVIERDRRFYFDLIGVNRQQLLDAGVQEKNIVDPYICTACRNDTFFSYRKDGPAGGRGMSVIMLK
jgi:YfiH family protein